MRDAKSRDSMSMGDAAVALRSLPRRFGEIVSGPSGDDAWERLARTADGSGHSALSWVATTTALVTELGGAIGALTLTAHPPASVATIESAPNEVPPATTIAALVAELRSAAERAATAVEQRRHDDFDRDMIVDGSPLPARDLVARVVRASVANLTHASEAIEAARTP